MNASLTRHCVLSLALLLPSAGLAATQTITLKDGSTVNGELVGINNGTYTVKTAVMGDVSIDSSQVVSINSPGAIPAAMPMPTQAEAPSAVGGQMQAIQSQMMSDPSFMMEMQQMMQDPEFMELISDPAVMQAVASKNPQALQNNPKGQALMNNPKMRALVERLQQK